MGAETKISWCDKTHNHWIGCTETSPACDFCYARDLSERYGWAKWGAGEPRHLTGEANRKKPLAWNRQAAKLGVRYSVFSLSLGDWADPEVPQEWRTDLEMLIDATPNLDWLLLSKRHSLVLKWALNRAPKKNVRLGFTVENQEWARRRLPCMGRFALEGWKTFVSYEPALGPVDWWPYLDPEGLYGGCIQWVIIGAESGHRRRPFDENWARETRDACQRAGVPFHYKQNIANGKPVHLPMLDGRQWAEFPTTSAGRSS